MSKRGVKLLKKTGFIFIAIVAMAMAINWFMTYKLEDALRKKLSSEVSLATDGFYNISFDRLNVGLFNGELVLKGLTFVPDSTTLKMLQDSAKVPDTYINVSIGAVGFRGLNLTWLFDYRKLSFDRFQVLEPNIKIYSTKKEEQDVDVFHIAQNKNLHEIISPYFDFIHTKKIDFQKANIEYIVEETTISHYKLSDFDFVAHNFLIDEYSQDREHLLFSDNFEFSTNTPQVILDSEHFLFNIGEIRLSTVDSIVYVAGIDLKTKEKHWTQRYDKVGSYSSVTVGDLELNGISFSRRGSLNLLEAKKLSVKKPNIEYYEVKGDTVHAVMKEVKNDSLAVESWSLYSITSPILERISIKNIDIGSAKFMYTQTKKKESDVYTLNRLDFLAHDFLIDASNQNFNIFKYVSNFSVDASEVKAHVASKNSVIDVETFKLSSIDKTFKILGLDLRPISLVLDKDHAYGKIEGIQITGISYNKGLNADLINIQSPQLNYVLSKTDKRKKKQRTKGGNNVTEKILNIVAPFVDYVTVKDIIIDNANASLIDRKSNNKYNLSDFDFYAKNFHIDKETRLLRDYFFKWDEYNFRFADFDNLTPDKKYRIQIKEGNFDSVTGNMLLRDLKVNPEEDNQGSYVRINTPFARLLGLNERAVKEKKISFKTFILESPVIEIVKNERVDDIKKLQKDTLRSSPIELINFDLLTIPSPSVFFYDVAKESSVQIQSIQVHIDSFKWQMNKDFSIHNLVIESPYISVVESKEYTKTDSENSVSIASFGDVKIGRVNIKHPILKIKKPNSYLDFSADNYLLKSFSWNQGTNSMLEIEDWDLSNPNLFVSNEGKTKADKGKLPTREEIIKKTAIYANRTRVGRLNISDLNMRYLSQNADGLKEENKLTNTNLLIENLRTDINNKRLDIDELAFSTQDVSYPIIDSFYTLRIKNVDFSNKRGILNVNDVRLDPNYPKFDFAYIHPRGADWFKVKIDSIALSGIDTRKLVSDTILLVRKLKIDHVLLENLKNQKIEIEHNPMPLLYQQFQRLPLKYNIEDLDIRDFSVVYEELPANGSIPARIPFTKMNGRIQNFTNIQRADSSFYTLYADGLAMGTSPFRAEWTIPIDSINDKFYLSAEIRNLDMRDFNQLIRPMAPAYVESGRINRLIFSTEATSLGATVDMQFTYDSLYLVLLKNMESEEKHKFFTRIVNRWGIKSYNNGENIRTPNMQIVRDPYHSNFNYFWQIIQPPLVESVGVTEEKKNLASNLVTIFNRIKRFFGGAKKEEKDKKGDTQDKKE